MVPLRSRALPAKQVAKPHLYRLPFAARRCKPLTSCAAAALPKHIPEHLAAASADWLQQCLDNPVQDQITGCKIYMYGVCHYAPDQHQHIQHLVDTLKPSCIALDVPPDATPGVLLPYPAWMQTALDHAALLSPEVAAQADTASSTAAANGSSSSNGVAQPAGAAETTSTSALHSSAELLRLYSELQAIAMPEAKIGRDIIDPFETFGYYAGIDYLRSSTHLAVAQQDCGFTPGWELAAAAAAAVDRGLRLFCLDAPVKLQESWVKALLQKFVVDAKGYAYQPQRDLEAVQALVSPELRAWDDELAARSAAEAANSKATPPAEAADGSLVGSPTERALVRFKVSRATAAAALTFDQTSSALAIMQRLQPLKFRHNGMRQLHMSRQLRDMCCRLATQAGVMPSIVTEVTPEIAEQLTPGANASSDSSSSSSSGGGSTNNSSSSGENSSTGSSSGTKESTPGATPAVPVVLALVGRQYVEGMQQLWRTPDSALWQDVMPKEFSPTTVNMELAAAEERRLQQS